MWELWSLTIVERILVSDHVLKITGLLNKLEILGAKIDGETRVDIVLQLLLSFF